MKEQAKIQLSPLEMELVMNSDWILTKNEIIQKARLLLEQLQEVQQKALLLSSIPEEVKVPSPKVSKGENYKGLPYLVLDQPRYFNKEDIFAIRTLFWWGNFFSCTLHLSGSYKTMYEGHIIDMFPFLQEGNHFVCLNTDPWEHDFGTANYIALQELNESRFVELIRTHPFTKLSKKINLEEWGEAVEKLPEIFNDYISIFR
jgi:hypothetical protein